MNEINSLLPIVKKSENVLNDLFKLKKDRINDNYVIFVRYIGFIDKQNHIKTLKAIYNKCTNIKESFLLIENSLTIPYEPIISAKIKDILTVYSKEDFESGKYIVELFNKFNFLKQISSENIIAEAIKTIVSLFITNEQNSNKDITINFIIKLVLWLNEYKGIFNNIVLDVPKIMYIGKIKKHEAYFLILLSYLQCDVIYINGNEDTTFGNIDLCNQYTYLIQGCIYDEIEKEIVDNFKMNSNVILQDNIDVKYLFKALKVRQNELSSESTPINFIRLIGVENTSSENIKKYCNSLMTVSQTLKEMNVGFLKFENNITVPQNDEIQGIEVDLNRLDEYICNYLNIKNENKIKLIVNAFENVINIFKKNECINESTLNNFLLKILIWLLRYKDELLNDTDIPKIFYYGKIKKHEVYFLIFSSLLGVDVLYVSPDKTYDVIFKKIDENESFTKLYELENEHEIMPLPKCSVIRKETIAYKATKELNEFIYSDGAETGMLKPWQLNECTIKPIILKTTIDEVKILWNEPSNIRPEFKVENNIVYIPTMFVKINGVFENINEYWSLISDLSQSENSIFIKDLPFSKLNYDRQEFYSLAYLLNEKGLIDKDKLFNSNLYKLKYLKVSLQNLIIDKANELMTTNMFQEHVLLNDKFRLKILMAVINLNENILKLLETYDFSSHIPKIIIYYDKKENLVIDDYIIIGILSLIGFDIVMFCPTNYNNMELAFNEGIFDIIQLPKVGLDLEIPTDKIGQIEEKKSFFAKIFGF